MFYGHALSRMLGTQERAFEGEQVQEQEQEQEQVNDPFVQRDATFRLAGTIHLRLYRKVAVVLRPGLSFRFVILETFAS